MRASSYVVLVVNRNWPVKQSGKDRASDVPQRRPPWGGGYLLLDEARRFLAAITEP
jgi:hypothetical protein